MLDFILDWIIDPVFDLLACQFRWGTWLKHLFVSGLLLLAMLAFAVILLLGWKAESWFWCIFGIAGTAFFGYIEFRYEIWWNREGRDMD